MSWQFSIASNVLILLLSMSFGNAALFDGCDYTYNVNAGYSYLESPYYPNKYPAGTSCRYKFVAPLDYNIEVQCTLALPQNGTACSTDYFYFAADGDTQLRGSEQFCGAGTFARNSLFRSAVLAYISYGGTGSFRCSLRAIPQACDCGWYSNTRIVNGQQTRINEYPSMAYLTQVGATQRLFCGASIISHRHALTAAHCALFETDASQIRLTVGDHTLTSATETLYAVSHGISRILIHPNYNANTDRNDIAIVYTSTIIEWSRGVGPVCLPPISSASLNYAFTNADVIGWGTTFFGGPPSNTLQKVTLQILQNSDCQSVYGSTQIYAEQICTYDNTGAGKDSCQLDSGGPVIRMLTRQFLIGLISYGQFCGQGGYATGVNTRVSSYLNWIQQNTQYTTCNVSM